MSTDRKEWGYGEEGEEEPTAEEPTTDKQSIIELERTYWKKKIRLIDIITENVIGGPKKPEKIPEKPAKEPKENPEES